MHEILLLGLALVVRILPSMDGAVDCTPASGQRLVDAYSAEFEPIWHHVVPTTVVDRVTEARTGRVTGLGPSDCLVVAWADETAVFDTTRPVMGAPNAFPFDPEFVRDYERLTGRSYVRDMMVVTAPKLGTQWDSICAVIDLYETIFSRAGDVAPAVRSFGTGSAGDVLVVSSRPRAWSWLDRCFGDDGTAYAEKLAKKGYRVGLVDGRMLDAMTVNAEGYVVLEGRRYATLVLRHLTRRDGARYRRVFGTRELRTKVYATDTPVLYGPELTWSDPDL